MAQQTQEVVQLQAWKEEALKEQEVTQMQLTVLQQELADAKELQDRQVYDQEEEAGKLRADKEAALLEDSAEEPLGLESRLLQYSCMHSMACTVLYIQYYLPSS